MVKKGGKFWRTKRVEKKKMEEFVFKIRIGELKVLGMKTHRLYLDIA
jgi:hypothetical protein